MTLYHDLAGDWEFEDWYLPNGKPPRTIQEYRKVLTEGVAVLGGYRHLSSNNKHDIVISNPDCYQGDVKVFEHPNFRYFEDALTWDCECVFTHLLGLKEVEKPKDTKDIEAFTIRYTMFRSERDLLYSFKSLDIQIEICKQLVRHRTLKVKSKKDSQVFGNQTLRTGVYIEDEGVVKELRIELKDQSGKGVGSLLKQCSAYGIELKYKKVMDDFKDCMTVPYKSIYPTCSLGWKANNLQDGDKWCDRPVNYETGEILHDWFVNYTKTDVTANFELNNRSYLNMKETAKKLGLNSNIKEFNTIASVTSRFVLMKIAQILQENENLFFNDKGFIPEMRKLLGQMLYQQSGERLERDFNPKITLLTRTDGGFCKNMNPRRCRIKIGSLVLDIDLKGCYMEGMVCQPYPIGRPIIKVFNDSDVKPTLREVFKQYQNEFVDNCWFIRFSSKIIAVNKPGKKTLHYRDVLPFEQDVFLSKIIDSKHVEDYHEDDDGMIILHEPTKTSDFQLLTRQLINCVLVHDNYQVLDHYAKPSERDYILDNTQVECLWYYPKSQLTNYREFLARFRDKGDDTYKYNNTWCIVPMKDIAQPYIDLRKQEKKAKYIAEQLIINRKTVFSDEDKTLFLTFNGNDWDYYQTCSIEHLKGIVETHDSGQYTFKITGLTIYGAAGSEHYQTTLTHQKIKKGYHEIYNPKLGHYLVANHITARARVAVWTKAKSLNLQVIITDGGFGDINKAREWDWITGTHRVGLHELSRMTNEELTAKELHNCRLNIRYVPIGNNGDWHTIGIEDKSKTLIIANDTQKVRIQYESLEDFDKIAYDHVSKQWSKLDIYKNKLIKFASKDMHGGAAIHSQANYILTPVTFEGQEYGEELIKFRGQQTSKKAYKTPHGREFLDTHTEHPIVTFMRSIFDNPESLSEIGEFYTDDIFGVNDFNTNDKARLEYIERGLLPGYSTSKRSFPKLISLSTFRWQSREQYESWKESDEKLKDKAGVGLEGYFQNDDGTYNYQLGLKVIQDMIDDGQYWINTKRTSWEHGVISEQNKIWAEMFPDQVNAFIPKHGAFKEPKKRNLAKPYAQTLMGFSYLGLLINLVLTTLKPICSEAQ